MVSSGERILIVESDPDISDLISRQTLKPLGYAVSIITEAAPAIQQALQDPPALIIANLNLPGLSGKDLLAALSSRGLDAPLIVVAEKGQEQSVIQAFRLGATDAIFWPAKDAEIVRVVERALQQTHETRARQRLGQQLESTRQELESNLKDLGSILAVGKAIISITDQRQLLGRILEAALQVANADMGWLMLRDEKSKSFLLSAYRNLPAAWAKKLNQPLDDGISALVALSGEPLSIHGIPLEKFKVAALGKSAAAVALKVRTEIIGLLVIVRKADREIEPMTQNLLQAMADFASISIVHARLFRAIEESGEAARLTEHSRLSIVESMRQSIRDELQSARYPLEDLLAGRSGPLTREQQRALVAIQAALERLSRSSEKTIPPESLRIG